MYETVAAGAGLFLGSVVGAMVVALAGVAKLRASAAEYAIRERRRIVEQIRREAADEVRSGSVYSSEVLDDVADDIWEGTNRA